MAPGLVNNSVLKPYGRLVDLKLDSAQKRLEAVLELNGEPDPVRVQIRSMDVIHSFFLPNFRVKQDAMPGMTIEIWFVPKQAGDFDRTLAEAAQ